MPLLTPIGFVGKPVASGGGSGGGTLVGTFLDTDSAANLAETYTFSGMSLGTAAGNRLIVAAVHGADNDRVADNFAQTVTIGGVAASLVVRKGQACSVINNSSLIELWQALVPTGTTGTVVVDYDFSAYACAVALYSITTNNQAAQSTGSDAAASGDTSLSVVATVPTNGYGIAAIFAQHQTSVSNTPTNWTEDYDTALATVVAAKMIGGHFTAGATLGAALTNNDGAAMVYASWGP